MEKLKANSQVEAQRVKAKSEAMLAVAVIEKLNAESDAHIAEVRAEKEKATPIIHDVARETSTNTASSNPQGSEFMRQARVVLVWNEKYIYDFFTHFEIVAKTLKWPEVSWAPLFLSA